MIELSYPYLFLLLPLPFLLSRILPPYHEAKPSVRTPFFDDLSRIAGSGEKRTVPSRRWGQTAILSICWLLLITGLTRPQYIEPPLTRTVPTRDLLLAVDLSGSMETEDFTNSKGETVTRLAAVKEVLHDFLKRRKGDRVGLILFGTAPFVQVPFTEDLDICTTLLDEAQVGMAGPRTMIGDSIGLAITVFEKSEVQDRVLILLTDGNDTGSSIPPEEAAKIAAARDIIIHTIAVGDPTAAGEAELDEASLKAIATSASGTYYHAANRDELQNIYDQLDRLDTREVETVSHRPKHDLFHYPLAVLFVLSFGYQLLVLVKSRGVPSRETGK